jgi:hypothetical protein
MPIVFHEFVSLGAPVEEKSWGEPMMLALPTDGSNATIAPKASPPRSMLSFFIIIICTCVFVFEFYKRDLN